MSFFSFKSKPKKTKNPADGDPDTLEPLRRPEPIYQNTPVIHEEDDESDFDSFTPSSILPPGVSLINPSLQPEKARNFANIRLPQTFEVRFLGVHPSTGIWGIKHTRSPVDNLVETAKTLDSDDLTLLDLEVSEHGVFLRQISPCRPLDTSHLIDLGRKPIERISYGVQDVIYPRIFAMIAIKEKSLIDDRPFDCFVFLCDNRIQSRKLAYCLAKAFKDYGDSIKAANYMQTLQENTGLGVAGSPKRANGGVSSSRSGSSKSSMADSSDA
ncbi:hypothetical protein BV898_05121 [Hypsibius exemplaris]|uniref:PID domain-containing protein n=1 Tax=Hypsibius exemplaris TaxID=2072580 RepID=A0A1W0X0S7_HYPEX|nr:hypothetical protein BV898_05121 [Hypsibius exemplaris]